MVKVDDWARPVYAQVRKVMERTVYADAMGLTAEDLLQCSRFLLGATCGHDLEKIGRLEVAQEPLS
jgi:hypothetical protein